MSLICFWAISLTAPTAPSTIGVAFSPTLPRLSASSPILPASPSSTVPDLARLFISSEILLMILPASALALATSSTTNASSVAVRVSGAAASATRACSTISAMKSAIASRMVERTVPTSAPALSTSRDSSLAAPEASAIFCACWAAALR